MKYKIPEVLGELKADKVGPLGSTDGSSVTDEDVRRYLTLIFGCIAIELGLSVKDMYKILFTIDKISDRPDPNHSGSRAPLIKNTPEGKACIQALNKLDWNKLLKKENEMTEETKTTESTMDNEANVEILKKLIRYGEVNFNTVKVCNADGMPDIKKVYAAMDRKNPGNMTKNWAVYINALYLSKLGYTDHEVCEIMAGVSYKKQGDIYVACEPDDKDATEAVKSFFNGKSGDARNCFSSMLDEARKMMKDTGGIAVSVNKLLNEIKPTVKSTFIRKGVSTVKSTGDKMENTSKKTNEAIKSHREERIAQLKAYPSNSKATRHFESASKERCIEVKVELERSKLLKKEKEVDESALLKGAKKAVKEFTRKGKDGKEQTFYSVKLKGFTGRTVALAAEIAAKAVVYGYKCPVIGYGVAACDLGVTYVYGKAKAAISWGKEKATGAYNWFKGLFAKKGEKVAVTS